MILVAYAGGFFAGLYYLITKKIDKRAALLFMVCCVIAFFMGLYFLINKGTSPIDMVERGDKGSSETILNMEVEAISPARKDRPEDKRTSAVDLSIAPVDYSIPELVELEKSLWEEILPLIPGDNPGLERVAKPLILPTKVSGYPFTISWQSDNQKLLYNDGRLGDEASMKGSLVNLRAEIGMEERDFSCEETLSVVVYPAADEASFWRRFRKYVMLGEKDSRQGRIFKLPEEFEGRRINYARRVRDSSAMVFMLGLFGAVALITAEKKNLEKQKKDREAEMEREYPQIVSKMSMLVGAGMTISGAFKKMSLDYAAGERHDKPLYDEMLLTSREVESGVSERKAWRNMGNRCQMPCVVRFCALISQYSQSGASGLRAALGAETDNALKERRERAKRLGEEAGTKLLFPMVMMLMVVMVIIMIPAFTSFGL